MLRASSLAVLLAATPLAAQVDLPLTPMDGWLVVPVVLDAADTLRFIVDTGASRSAVSATTVRRHGLRAAGTVEVEGASGPASLGTVHVPRLGVGELLVANLRALVLDDATVTPGGGRTDGTVPLDGVLGADILRRFDVLISAPEGRMVLFDPRRPSSLDDESFGPPIAVSTAHEPLLRHRARVNGLSLTALLDTGSRRIVMNLSGARRAGVDEEAGSAEVSSPGVGDQSTVQSRTTLDSLRVGELRLLDVPAHLADLPVFASLGLARLPAVILGAPTVMRCAVFISYSEHHVRYCRRPSPGPADWNPELSPPAPASDRRSGHPHPPDPRRSGSNLR